MRAGLGIVLLVSVGCAGGEPVEPKATADVDPATPASPEPAKDEPKDEPESDPPTKEASAFAAALAAAKPGELESIEAVIAAFEADADADPKSTAQNWPALVTFYEDAAATVNEHHGQIGDYLECMSSAEGCDETFLRTVSEPDKKLAAGLVDLGFGVGYAGEGMYELTVSLAGLRMQLKLDERLEKPDLAYLDIQTWLASTMFFDDEVIAVDEKQLREGLTLLETYLAEHPGTAHEKEVAERVASTGGLYLELCFHEKMARKKCKPGKGMVKGYRKFVSKHPKSKLAPAVKEILEIVDGGQAITKEQVIAVQKKHGFDSSFAF